MQYPLSVPGIDLYNGKFTDGLPGTRPASVIPSVAINALIDEVLAVIVAGGLTPSEGTVTQLRDALNLTYPRINNAPFSVSPTAPTPTTGDRSTKLATTAMFSSEFLSSLIANGYQKLPGGLIIQWGTAVSNASGISPVVFPISFLNSAFAVFSTEVNSGNGTITTTLTSITGTQLNYWNAVAGNVSAGAGITSNWFAIGK